MSMTLGEKIWKVINAWNYFDKNTIGKQLVRASDSIAANLSEGFGRYHYRESKNFTYYSRGSLFETKTWITKAYNRHLIPKKDYLELTGEIDIIGIKLNKYIKTLGPPKK